MKIPSALWTTVLVALSVATAHAQGARKQDARDLNQGVDPKKVDAAIEKGKQWLLAEKQRPRTSELVLYTLKHAGLDPQHEVFQSLLQSCLEEPLEETYNVSILAMFLSEFNPSKYQEKIAECCQFLVDNQFDEGLWSYGAPTTFAPFVRTPSASRDVATPSKPRGAVKVDASARPKSIIQIKRQAGVAGQGKNKGGDNSNTQYAALGLRACMEANVFPPQETLVRAKSYWEKTQHPDGGWGYGTTPSYGSMTLGGLASLILYKTYLKEPWQADERVVKGFEWVTENFSVDGNPKRETHRYFYYMYALERLGIFGERTTFGAHDWYREGANKLLALQRPEGNWAGSDFTGGTAADTCFAILFLRRATPPLQNVASVDRVLKR